MIEEVNIKRARAENGGLYAWLYRHDSAWLLSVNRRFYLLTARPNRRVDWQRRDLCTCRQLIKIRKVCQSLLDSPRRSKNWYLSKLDNSATVEKNIRKMPLTALFFNRHCEGVSDYQVRRLNLALHCLGMDCKQKWRLLRLAGLSEERLSHEARSWLNNRLGS